MDLIDRQAAIKALDGEFHITGKDNAITVADYLNGITQALKCVPSALVRCKECDNYASGVCYAWRAEVEEDGYCHLGRRQDG